MPNKRIESQSDAGTFINVQWTSLKNMEFCKGQIKKLRINLSFKEHFIDDLQKPESFIEKLGTENLGHGQGVYKG